MSGWTQKGKMKVLGWGLQGNAIPANFSIALVNSQVVPTNIINTKGELSLAQTGYGLNANGLLLALDTVDFDLLDQSITNFRGLIQIKNCAWTASGGAIPANGLGASYAILTDVNATDANREVYYFWYLGSNVSVSDGQELKLVDLEIRINES